MEITPIEIQQRRFRQRLMGYDKAAVDGFLEEVANEMTRLHRESQQLKENLAHVHSAMEELKEREGVLKETLITTQKITDDMKQNARREAELIIREGRMRAEKIIRGAEEKRFLILDEINELHRQKTTFMATLGSLLERHRRLLDLEDGSHRENDLPWPPADKEEIELVEEVEEITASGFRQVEEPVKK